MEAKREIFRIERANMLSSFPEPAFGSMSRTSTGPALNFSPVFSRSGAIFRVAGVAGFHFGKAGTQIGEAIAGREKQSPRMNIKSAN